MGYHLAVPGGGAWLFKESNFAFTGLGAVIDLNPVVDI